MPWTEKDRLEGDMPRPEYLWMNSVNNGAGPGNLSGIPKGLKGMSENPDEVLAWIKKNCKFAMGAQNDVKGAVEGGGVLPS